METMQIFFNIKKPGLDNAWNENISTGLKQITGVEIVEIIDQHESSSAQINISCNMRNVQMTDMVELVKNNGAVIEKTFIHFPSGATGISDPYGAKNNSFSIKENIKSINGVDNVGITSDGKVKVSISLRATPYQQVLEEINKVIYTAGENNA